MSDASKVWLVTGGSRGFGAALIRAALDHGENVVATARQPQELSGLIAKYGAQVSVVGLDVTDQAAAQVAVETAVERFGRLDVVVNNAGYANSAAIEEMDPDDFRAQIETNLFGVVNVTRAALPVLRQQRSGVFVQFSSVGGRVGGTPGMGAYQTAKFGVEGFSEVLAAEVNPLGIKVIIVEPGAFRTDWQGTSMVMKNPGADYMQTVGVMHEFRQATDGTQPGDPARAAAIIVDVVAMSEPPRRLLLGAGAVDQAISSGLQREQEARDWAVLSRSADLPGAPAMQRPCTSNRHHPTEISQETT